MAYSKENIHGSRLTDYEDELWDDDISLSDASEDDSLRAGDSGNSEYSGTPVASDHSEDYEDSYRSEDIEDSYRSEDTEDPEDPDDSEDAHEDFYSSEDSDAHATPDKPRKRRFGFHAGKSIDEDNDFYDSEAEPEEKPKPKPQVLDPENPDYWIEDEPEIPSIIPQGRRRWKWILAAVSLPILVCLAAWIWMFNPYVEGGVKYGYLKHMERRGSLIKTFEGEMIPYREVSEHTPVYFEDFRFSVAADTTAARMKSMMLQGIPVRIEYDVYHTSLPWRGEHKVVVTGVDTADLDKILPPEFRLPGELSK